MLRTLKGVRLEDSSAARLLEDTVEDNLEGITAERRSGRKMAAGPTGKSISSMGVGPRSGMSGAGAWVVVGATGRGVVVTGVGVVAIVVVVLAVGAGVVAGAGLTGGGVTIGLNGLAGLVGP